MESDGARGKLKLRTAGRRLQNLEKDRTLVKIEASIPSHPYTVCEYIGSVLCN